MVRGENFKTKCYECGEMMEGRKSEYKYTECGLSSVLLKDILVYHCPKCNAVVPEIPAAGVLHRVIALRIITKRNLLSGEEIRFLRKLCGYSVNDLAEILGSTKHLISRIEKSGCGKENDRVIRLLVLRKFILEISRQPEPLLRRVTVEDLNSEIEMTFREMAGRSHQPIKYEIPPEEIAKYSGDFAPNELPVSPTIPALQ